MIILHFQRQPQFKKWIISYTSQHNVYYRTLNRKTTSRERDSTAFNLMKLPQAKVAVGQES